VSLRDWLNNGWLKAHRSSREEIRSLLRIAERDLKDARAANVSSDNRFVMAYNAALAASGYRTEKGDHHYRTLQSLEFTIGAGSDLVVRLDALRKKRSFNIYKQEGSVSDSELKEMIETASRLRSDVEEWLKQKHPELV
jgi:hypothetical protein